MKISIIIPYRDRKQSLSLILKQFVDQKDFNQQDYEIVIVNLGSEHVDLGGNAQAKEEYVHYKGIFSRGWALNIGVKQAAYDYVMLLDADVLPHPEFLSLIQKHFDTANPHFVINSPVMFLNNVKTQYIFGQESYSMKDYQNFKSNRGFWLKPKTDGTSQICLAKKFFIDLGGFDESFVGHGGEDLVIHDQIATHLSHWGKWPRTIEVKWAIDRDLILLHLYHGKRNYRSPYLANYRKNWERYRDTVKRNIMINNQGREWGLINKPPS